MSNDAVAQKIAQADDARERLLGSIEVMDQEVRLETLFQMESLAWRAVAGIAAAAAGLAATKLLGVFWDKAMESDAPPEDPSNPETSTKDAVVWTVLSGVLVGLASVFAQRGAAQGWMKATGDLPPAFKKKRKGAVAKKGAGASSASVEG